jgi:hypothetical protein
MVEDRKNSLGAGQQTSLPAIVCRILRLIFVIKMMSKFNIFCCSGLSEWRSDSVCYESITRTVTHGLNACLIQLAVWFIWRMRNDCILEN